MKIRCMLIVLILIRMVSPSVADTPVSKTKVPSWVKIIAPEINSIPQQSEASGFYYLLLDKQEDHTQKTQYFHNAYKILNNEGLQSMADISVDFDPSYQKLSFHSLVIYRDGQKIDKLSSALIKTIQRESSMERYLYDGSITALIHLEDVRLGDVVEYSFSRTGEHPAEIGHYSGSANLQYSLPVKQIHHRLVLDKNKNLNLSYLNGSPEPQIIEIGNRKEFVWNQLDVKALMADNDLPIWYNPYPMVQMSDFENWEDMARWAFKHFQIDNKEIANLKKEILSLIPAGENQEETVDMLIHFVQDEIRYLGFESGLNSYIPHSPLQVLKQRFGDCKDKSLLLSELLKIYGIEAYPVLINTAFRKKTENYWPSPKSFDHCIVNIRLKGKDHFIDPTYSNQGGHSADFFLPDYGKGLVIKSDASALTDIPTSEYASVDILESFEIKSIEEGVSFKVISKYYGGEADNIRSYFVNNSLDYITKQYEEYYTNLYSRIKASSNVKIEDNKIDNVFTMYEEYQIDSLWLPYITEDNTIYCEFYPLTLEGKLGINKNANRNSPHALLYPTKYYHEIKAEFPMDLDIEKENKNISSDLYRYTRKVGAEGRQLTINHEYITYSDHVPVENIPQFVTDYQSIMGLLSYQITYNKDLANNASPAWVNALLLCSVFGLFIFMAWRIYWRFNPESRSDAIEKDLQIGGWLILLAIAIVISPFRIFWDIYNYPELFQLAVWKGFYAQGRFGFLTLLVFEMFYNVSALVFSVLVLILFFQRRTSFPLVFTVFLAGSLFFTILDIYVASFFLEESAVTPSDYADSLRTIFSQLIAAAIWIPYVRISDRAKSTFTQRKE